MNYKIRQLKPSATTKKTASEGTKPTSRQVDSSLEKREAHKVLEKIFKLLQDPSKTSKAVQILEGWIEDENKNKNSRR